MSHPPSPAEQPGTMREAGAVKVCTQCGAEFGPDKNFCPDDGSVLRATGPRGGLVGQLIAGRYRVLQKLGEGGMSQVYLAEHVKIGRKDAIKILHPELASDAEAVRRFHREASNASRIVHPNVAAIYDFGETPDGLTYLAMEYVDGKSLSALLENGTALPVARAVAIARQVADALQAAHELGIVHRDLKPENIVVAARRDGRDVVKVIDFGIAKAFQPGRDEVTRPGIVVGTPEYMSPEQLTGHPLDGRSDIYSLGCILYRMLTGELPFVAPDRELVATLRLAEPPPHPRAINPGVPSALDAAVIKALATSPESRFQTAAEFGAALAAPLASAPDPVRLPHRQPQLSVPSTPPRVVARRAAPSRSVAEGETVPFRRRATTSPGSTRTWLGGGVVVLAALGAVLWSRREELAAPSFPPPIRSRAIGDTGSAGASSSPQSQPDTQSPPPLSPTASDTPRDESRGASAVGTGAPAESVASSFAVVRIDRWLPNGSTTTVDGRVVSGRLVRISPDTTHTIMVTAPGFYPEVRSIAAAAGDTVSWSPVFERIEPVAATAAPPADTLPTAPVDTAPTGPVDTASGAVAMTGGAGGGRNSAERPTPDTVIERETAAEAPPPVLVDSTPARIDEVMPQPSAADTTTTQALVAAANTPRPQPSAAVSDERIARVQIESSVDGYLVALRSKDTGRIGALYKPVTDSDVENERDLLKLMRTPGSRLAVVDRQVDPPQILGSQASVRFRVKLAWRTPFGASRSQAVTFLAELQRSGNGWQITRSRIVGTPDLD